MIKLYAFRLLISTFVLLPLWGVRAQAPGEGARVNLQLKQAGFVTVAINDAKGKRIRNLFGGKWLEAGNQMQVWDGLDDTCQPVPAGNYQWKGLVHQGLQTEFQGAFNSPGDPPWLTAEIGGAILCAG